MSIYTNCKGCNNKKWVKLWQFPYRYKGSYYGFGGFQPAKRNESGVGYENGRLLNSPCKLCNPFERPQILYVGPQFEASEDQNWFLEDEYSQSEEEENTLNFMV